MAARYKTALPDEKLLAAELANETKQRPERFANQYTQSIGLRHDEDKANGLYALNYKPLL